VVRAVVSWGKPATEKALSEIYKVQHYHQFARRLQAFWSIFRLRPVFVNLFAATEPSGNVCIAHGTLCNDPSVYPIFCNKPDGYKCSIYVLLYFGGTVCSHSRNAEVPRNTGWKTLA